MKIYTKKGDAGQTSLYGGQKISKHHPRVDSYGTVDELNAWIGLIKDTEQAHREFLSNIQEQLFCIGAHLATQGLGKKASRLPQLNKEWILELENAIDTMDTDLPAMTHFVLPGGHQRVSYVHISRAVCRRAERCVSGLMLEDTDKFALKYLNRLSDYLFVLSRNITHQLGIEEQKWMP